MNPVKGGRRRSSAFFLTGGMTHSRSSPDCSCSHVSTSPRESAAVAAKSAARSVANFLIACFAPPESNVATNDSFASSTGNVKNGSSIYSIYGSPNKLSHTREPGRYTFTMDKILEATRNFSPSFKIGQGGFATVYKGQLRDGTLVAVKRARKDVYDKRLGTEFHSEVQTLAQVEHLNLVTLYGYLEHEDERILVIEYVPNGTLREHLDCVNRDVLDFASRIDIAIDVAHAITYLHMYTDNPLIHRDIKSSNILLTQNLRAKVADFGFARLAADGDSGETHVLTRVKGTAGYVDPEYLVTNQLTDKSDVYSFGVLLVELVTGRRPIEPKRDPMERMTIKWAMRKFTSGEALLALDPRLVRSPANNFATEKIFELSFQCQAPHRNNRPPMRRCAEILWGIRKGYRELG